MYFKNEKGVTLMALTITIIVMLILSSIIIHSSDTHIDTQSINKLYSDIDNLNNKINKYYLEYGDIPILPKQYCGKEQLTNILNNNANAKSVELNNLSKNDDDITVLNPNDEDAYYIIDLEKMEGLTLNYGYDIDYKKAKQDVSSISTDIQDIYIINKVTHQIYYPKGIFSDEYMYYCYNLNFKEISVDIGNITGWKYKEDSNGRKTIITNGTIDLTIGTYINYNAAATDADGKNLEEKTIVSETGSPTTTDKYKAKEQTLSKGNGYDQQIFSNKVDTNGWRILGVNEKTNEMLIISTDPIKTTDNNDFALRGIAGYIYGIEELNKICSLFGKGYGATGARSVNIEDVNKITGYNPKNIGKYDPTQSEIGNKYEEGQCYEYGNKVTYSWTSENNKISWLVSDTKSGTGSKDDYKEFGFNWYDTTNKVWENSMQDILNPKTISTLINSHYYYSPDSLTTEEGTGEGISTTSEEYKMMFMNKSETKKGYWLASSYVYTDPNYAGFGMRVVGDSGFVGGSSLYYSYGSMDTRKLGIRPVVSLKANIQLEKQEDGSYNIIK